MILAYGLWITFTLRWSISGTIIGDVFSELFIQGVVEKLNDGLIPGVAPSHEAGDGATYVLLWGTTELQWQDGDGRTFHKDYGVPSGAELTVSDLSLASFAAAFDLLAARAVFVERTRS